MENDKVNDLSKIINNAEFLSDDILDGMDFYQLSSYIQTLNMLDSLNQISTNEGAE